MVSEAVFYGYRPMQIAISSGQLKDGMNVYSWLMEQPGTFSRFSSLLFSGAHNGDTFMSFIDLPQLLPPQLPSLSTPTGQFETKDFTHLIVADLRSIEGLEFALEAVLHMASSGDKARLSFLHNGHTSITAKVVPTSGADQEQLVVARALQTAISSSRSLKRIFPFVVRLLASALRHVRQQQDSEVPLDLVARVASESQLDRPNEDLLKEMQAALSGGIHATLTRQCQEAVNSLGLAPGQRAVVTNGRIVRLHEGYIFTRDDLKLLEKYEAVMRVDFVKPFVEDKTHHGIHPDDLTRLLSSPLPKPLNPAFV